MHQSPSPKRDTFRESLLEQLIAKYASPTRAHSPESRPRYNGSPRVAWAHEPLTESDHRPATSPTPPMTKAHVHSPLFSQARVFTDSHTPTGWRTSMPTPALSTIAKPRSLDTRRKPDRTPPSSPLTNPRATAFSGAHHNGDESSDRYMLSEHEGGHQPRLSPSKTSAAWQDQSLSPRWQPNTRPQRSPDMRDGFAYNSNRVDWLERRVVELSEQLRTVTQERETLIQHVNRLTAANDALKVDVGQRDLIIQDLKNGNAAQLELFNKAVAAHEQRTTHLKQALQETERQKTDAEGQCKEVLAMCEAQQRAITSLRCQMAKLQGAVANAETREAQARELEQRLRRLLAK